MKKKVKVKNNIEMFIKNPAEKRREARQKRRRLYKIFLSAILLMGLLSYFSAQFIGEKAKLKSVLLTNNLFFSEKQIFEVAQIDYDANFYLMSTKKIAARFKDWEITQVKVIKRANQIIELHFNNADLLAYFYQDSELFYLDSNNRSYKHQEDYKDLRKLLPLLVDYSELERAELIAVLKLLKRPIVYQISEISHHRTSYDENMIKLLMEDGIQVFLDFEAMELMNSYNKMVETITTYRCIRIDSYTGRPYTFDCTGE